MLKEFLSQQGVNYQEKDVSIDRNAGAELVRITGQMAVPVTLFDNQAVIGFDRPRLEQLISSMPQTPSLGTAVGDAARITRMRGLPLAKGAYIGGVKQGSLAQRIGLAVGDIITEINDHAVEGPDDLEKIIANFHHGDHVSISFSRGEQRLEASGII
jgi:glutaredoxin 3